MNSYLKRYSPNILKFNENRLAKPGEELADSEKGTQAMVLIDKLLEMEERNVITRSQVSEQIETFAVGASDMISTSSSDHIGNRRV